MVKTSKIKIFFRDLNELTTSFKLYMRIILLIREYYTKFNFGLKNVEKIITRNIRCRPRRIKKVTGKYYWSLYIPGFPSKAFQNALEQELYFCTGSNSSHLIYLIIAITKKCGLNCAHCFEWNVINKDEAFSDIDLYNLICESIKKYKPAQIFLSGGEPFARFNLIKKILSEHKGGPTSFWIISSGLGVTKKRITLLKKLGLTGLMISLDHYSSIEHNKFRGNEKSYVLATEAISIAKKSNLVTALSLCPQKSKLDRNFLDKYLEFANQLGVEFVQILEPKAEGRYMDKDVKLNSAHISLLEKFYMDYRFSKKFRNYPILAYPDYLKRKKGCEGFKSFAYIDTDGNINPCPFCKCETTEFNNFQCTNSQPL